MNILKQGNKYYKYESFWRKSKNDNMVDKNNNKFPWPKPSNTKWQNEDNFIPKLKDVQKSLLKTNFIAYKPSEYTSCHICGKKNVNKGIFTLNNIRWENGLIHYIEVHNIRPSDIFIDIIFRYDFGKKFQKIKLKNNKFLKGTHVVRHNQKFLKIDRNQMLIMDALMKHGSEKQYIDDRKKVFRYSEHAGLLDFNKTILEKVIVYANTTRVDPHDDDIFLPGNLVDAFDYEYIFHTHPATPKPGGRADVGILYEFPSMGDIFHFIDHFNDGNTQGSIVITAEGIYIIRKKTKDLKKILVNEDKLYKQMMKEFSDIQDEAIKKYGVNFSANTFYSKIAQDKQYINRLNKIANKYMIHIDFYPRIKDEKGNWIIDTVYVPVYPVELAN